MVLIRLILTIATIFITLLEYKELSKIRINFFGLLVGLIFISLSYGVYLTVMWPLLLYSEGLSFFKFPNKNMNKQYLYIFEHVNKNH